jgi:hypothetical protein
MALQELARRSREEGAPREIERARSCVDLAEEVIGDRDGGFHLAKV